MKRFCKYVLIALFMTACGGGGGGGTSGGGGNTGGGGNNGGGGNTGGGGSGGTTTCNCVNISQENSGTSTESSLNITYDGNLNPVKIVVFDSVNNVKNFEADLRYLTTDSVEIDQYQYFILDQNKRVAKFVTRSDLKDPANADVYLFKYTYNSDGFLVTKELYINGSSNPDFTTTYSYTNNLLTKCEMLATSSGSLLTLESVITYDQSKTIKNWIYTFPDGIEGYTYLAALNFGKKSIYPPQQIITKIYDPPTGNLLDTWTTNYSNYSVNADGYLTRGYAGGDLQEGIGSFYGDTKFYYQCH